LASAIATNEVMKHKQRDRDEEEQLSRENQELTEAVDRLQTVVLRQEEDIAILNYIIDSYRRNINATLRESE
jgi:hypothetical protein